MASKSEFDQYSTAAMRGIGQGLALGINVWQAYRAEQASQAEMRERAKRERIPLKLLTVLENETVTSIDPTTFKPGLKNVLLALRLYSVSHHGAQALFRARAAEWSESSDPTLQLKAQLLNEIVDN